MSEENKDQQATVNEDSDQKKVQFSDENKEKTYDDDKDDKDKSEVDDEGKLESNQIPNSHDAETEKKTNSDSTSESLGIPLPVTDDENIVPKSNVSEATDRSVQTETPQEESTTEIKEEKSDKDISTKDTKNPVENIHKESNKTDDKVTANSNEDTVVIPKAVGDNETDNSNVQPTQTENHTRETTQTETSTNRYSLNSRAPKPSQVSTNENVQEPSNTYATDDEKVTKEYDKKVDAESVEVNIADDSKSDESLIRDEKIKEEEYHDDFDEFIEDEETSKKQDFLKENESESNQETTKTGDRGEGPKSEQDGQSNKVDPECEEQTKQKEKEMTKETPRKNGTANNSNGGYTITTKYTKPKTPPRAEVPKPIPSKASPTESKRGDQNAVPRRKAQSARYSYERKGNQSRDGGSTSRTSSRVSSRPSLLPRRARTALGIPSEERRRKEKEFFHAELRRLKDSLKSESKKIKKPKVRDHYPDVFTSLEPYYNTYTASYLINMPDLGYKEKQHPEVVKGAPEEEESHDPMFTTRKTAIGLCTPETSLSMDKAVLPKLETAEMKKKRMQSIYASQNPKSGSSKSSGENKEDAAGKREKRPEAKQGSTRLPKFPVINTPDGDLSKRELHYGDVPMLRNELYKNFSHNGDGRVKDDYTRTRQDFFRMELDRVEDYNEFSRPHMRAAYFAYLQNTPGSRKAVYDCMKEIQKKKKEETQPQAVA